MKTGFRILFLSAEVAPFSKVGGLGDVAGSLPRVLARRGHALHVVSPWYSTIDAEAHGIRVVHEDWIRFDGRKQRFQLGKTKYEGVDTWFVGNPDYFHRSGIYTDTTGEGYADNGKRFLFFQLVMSRLIADRFFRPDVLHSNDHHTALVPLFCRLLGRSIPAVLTLHNVSYQGHLSPDDIHALPPDLAEELRRRTIPPAWLNPLAVGVETAREINTVSPTYARELLRKPTLAGELHPFLRRHRTHFRGILNGIDTSYWNPARDPYLSSPYDSTRLERKEANKQTLIRECGLELQAGKPLIGSVSRLVQSKGIDLIIREIPHLLEEGAALVFLGTGAKAYQQALQETARQHPGRVYYSADFNEPLAHRIEAGADLFLMPSRFEPCGLNQMYSLRYGTLPVVHRTGGLADSVVPWNQPGGCGFVFHPYRIGEFRRALREAMHCFEDRRLWRRLQRNGMGRDFSWERSAQEYELMYIDALKREDSHAKT